MQFQEARKMNLAKYR